MGCYQKGTEPTLGLFVPRFGRLCLIGSSLALLGRTASAGFGGLVLFRGRLLLDRLFLLLSRLVTGGGKIHHLAGMCRGGVILAGIGRLLLFSLGDFGRGRLLHSAWVTASAGSGTASPISKSAACPSCSSMTASASVSAGPGEGCSSTAAFSTAGAGASVGGAASGMFFLSSAICKPPFSWHEKSQSADWPGGSNLPSWFYI